MKIFKDKKVYVQMDDLEKLSGSLIPMPISIFENFFSQPLVVSDFNRYDFVGFIEPEEVEFFESIDWIVDYNKYMRCSENQIILMLQERIEQINELAREYSRVYKSINEDKSELRDLLNQYRLKEHEIRYIKEILAIKKGESEIVLHNFKLSDKSKQFKN